MNTTARGVTRTRANHSATTWTLQKGLAAAVATAAGSSDGDGRRWLPLLLLLRCKLRTSVTPPARAVPAHAPSVALSTASRD